MPKSYVPEGTYTACDKGSSPNQIRVTNHESVTIYNQPMATERDLLPFFNIKPMGLCTSPAKWATGVSCLPTVFKWEEPKDGVKINGNRMLLLEDSYCKCLFGGTIRLFPDRPSAAAYGVGDGKMPSEYIKELFDSGFEGLEKGFDWADDHLPDWMNPALDYLKWRTDFTVGLVEGAVNGVVGLGEVIYQVGQDPVGMAEAIGDMASDAWDATSKGVTNAYNWASEPENWSNAAEGAWEWGSDPDNWKQAASDGWDATTQGIEDAGQWVADNPRAMGNGIGEFIPDAVAAVYTGGGSLAATSLKTGGKKLGKEVVEEMAEQTVKKKAAKEVAEEIAEAAAKKKGPPGKVVTRPKLTPEDFGTQLLSKNPEFLKLWNDTLKKLANSNRDNIYKRYLKNLENGTPMDNDFLSDTFSYVRQNFKKNAENAGHTIDGEIHHWNYPKHQYPDEIVNPNNLTEPIDRATHEAIHEATSSGTNKFVDPIDPLHEIPNNSFPIH